MKYIYLPLLLVSFFANVHAQNIVFPDSLFKKEIIQEGYDLNHDGEISLDEGEKVISLYIENNDIKSLQGINLFPNLVILSFSCNIDSLDLSKNYLLETLDCDAFKIKYIQFPTNSALKSIMCRDNVIDSLDLSTVPLLEFLNCSSTSLRSLNVAQNKKLQYLSFNNTTFKEVDLSKNSELKHIEAMQTGLLQLDLSQNTKLTYLSCGYSLTSLDLNNNQLLDTLELYCFNMTSLDIRNNTQLKFLNFYKSDLNVCVWTLPFPIAEINDASAVKEHYTTDCTITNIEEQTTTNEFVYAYESEGTLVLKYALVAPANLKIMNMHGQEFYDGKLSENTTEHLISTQGWNSGMYFLQLVSNEKLLSVKTIKN